MGTVDLLLVRVGDGCQRFPMNSGSCLRGA